MSTATPNELINPLHVLELRFPGKSGGLELCARVGNGIFNKKSSNNCQPSRDVLNDGARCKGVGEGRAPAVAEGRG